MEQIDAALECGATSVIADFRESRRYGNAIRAAHLGGASILLASPRIHKPGEGTVPIFVSGAVPIFVSAKMGLSPSSPPRDSSIFDQLADETPDGILVRNLAALGDCRRKGLPAVADFALNAANDLSVEWLHGHGARRVTAAYDLNRDRLLALAAAVPPEWLEVVVHRHTPMFHSEYCMFCGMLSSGDRPSFRLNKNRTVSCETASGTSKADCGRPCDRHAIRLRDRMGVEHVLLPDGQCRNTLFHAEAESLLEIMPSLQERGVRHFRVELLLENSVEDVRRTLTAYRRLCNRS